MRTSRPFLARGCVAADGDASVRASLGSSSSS